MHIVRKKPTLLQESLEMNTGAGLWLRLRFKHSNALAVCSSSQDSEAEFTLLTQSKISSILRRRCAARIWLLHWCSTWQRDILAVRCWYKNKWMFFVSSFWKLTMTTPPKNPKSPTALGAACHLPLFKSATQIPFTRFSSMFRKVLTCKVCWRSLAILELPKSKVIWFSLLRTCTRLSFKETLWESRSIR